MPVYEGVREAVVAAPPKAAFEAMTDYDRLPEWQGALRKATVLSTYDDGLARQVEYEVDAKLRRVTYRLSHTYDPPTQIDSEYLGGDFDHFEGRWHFERVDDERTAIRLELRIDPGLPLPGRLVRMLNKRVLFAAVEDLRRHLEEH